MCASLQLCCAKTTEKKNNICSRLRRCRMQGSERLPSRRDTHSHTFTRPTSNLLENANSNIHTHMRALLDAECRAHAAVAKRSVVARRSRKAVRKFVVFMALFAWLADANKKHFDDGIDSTYVAVCACVIQAQIIRLCTHCSSTCTQFVEYIPCFFSVLKVAVHSRRRSQPVVAYVNEIIMLLFIV